MRGKGFAMTFISRILRKLRPTPQAPHLSLVLKLNKDHEVVKNPRPNMSYPDYVIWCDSLGRTPSRTEWETYYWNDRDETPPAS